MLYEKYCFQPEMIFLDVYYNTHVIACNLQVHASGSQGMLSSIRMKYYMKEYMKNIEYLNIILKIK